MTFNRKNPISTLEKLYSSAENKVVVFYSSSDSDLHTVIKEFLASKDFFYYRAVQVSSEEQLNLFKLSINEQFSKTVINEPGYAGALKAMIQAKCEKRVVVIDQFEHIIKYSNELIEEILKCINNKWGNQPVLFILSSTNSYFVEKQMVEKLGQKAYEFSGLIKLADLSFIDVMKYFDKYSNKDLVLTYGITGGKSSRILAFDKNKSLKENIINSILSEDGALYKRGFDILPKELREYSVYNTILVNIAAGHTKLNELHKLTGYSRAKISVYINNLIEHGLIEKIDSYDSLGKDNTIKGIYTISDGLLSFFYRFIYPNVSILSVIDKEKFYKQYIEPFLYDFGADAFRKVCFEYLMILNKMDKLPIKVINHGTWIGKIGNIDIVLSDNNDRNIIALCEFRKDTITYEDFEWLKFCVSKAKLTDDIYYLFSKDSFDERIKMYAEEVNNLVLVDLSML